MAVTERLPGGALTLDGSNLYRVSREFDVDATSRFHAASELKAEKGIEFGAVFVDHDGVSPVVYLRCTQIEITARTPPPGGSGKALYHGIAHYGVMDGVIPYPDGPAVWRAEGALQEVPADVDKNGVAITNSAGVPFTNPLGTLRPNLVAIAVWISTGVSFSEALKLARTYRGKVNSVLWLGADPREVLCRDILPTLMQPGLVRYEAHFEFRNSYKVFEGEENEVEVPGWDEATTDRGLHYRGQEGKLHPIMTAVELDCSKCSGTGKVDSENCTDCNGTGKVLAGHAAVTEPVLLDGAGQELVPEQVECEECNGTGEVGGEECEACEGRGFTLGEVEAVVLVFSVLPEADFTGIGIS